MRTGDSGIRHGIGKDFVAIGYIAKLQGIKGDVKVIPLTDVPGRYDTLKKVFIQTRSGEIKDYCIKVVREGRSGLIVGFTPPIPVSEAEGLIGGQIIVPESEVPKLGKDSYYHFEIIDMEVYTDAGRYLGKIVDILTTGSNDVYVVKDKDRDYLIPAIHDVVKEVDTKAKRMIISLIEGLI